MRDATHRQRHTSELAAVQRGRTRMHNTKSSVRAGWHIKGHARDLPKPHTTHVGWLVGPPHANADDGRGRLSHEGLNPIMCCPHVWVGCWPMCVQGCGDGQAWRPMARHAHSYRPRRPRRRSPGRQRRGHHLTLPGHRGWPGRVWVLQVRPLQTGLYPSLAHCTITGIAANFNWWRGRTATRAGGATPRGRR